MPRNLPSWIGLLVTTALGPAARAQLGVGTVEGQASIANLEIVGPVGTVIAVRSDSHGHFSVALPYGEYTIRSTALEAICRVRVRPFQTAHCDLQPGENRTADSAEPAAGAANASEQLLFQAPATVTNPLDFAYLGAVRLPLISNRATHGPPPPSA